jgi:hypothetical protein
MTCANVSAIAEEAIGVLLKLAHLVEVTGHASGKIETRVSFADLPTVLALLRGVDVDRGLRLIPGLKGYEVSVWSRSATIAYDPTVLPVDFWNHFGTIRKDPSVEGVVRERLHALLPKDSDSQAVLNGEPSAEE